MITEDKAPIWYDYVEMDKDYNTVLRQDAPQDVREAYEAHLRELEKASKEGIPIFKE